jgi:hypothetical protein
MAKGAPKQDGIVAAIVLAVSNSRLKIKADRSTLNSVISGQYRDLVKDGALRLQVLWNLLKDLPGFDKEDAKSAFCALDSWADDFVMKVELPDELQSMSDAERSQAAARCSVTDAKKKQALFPGSELSQAGRRPTAPGNRSSQDIPKHASGGDGGGTKRLIKILVAVALVAGGITAYTVLSGGQNEVALSTISDALPIESATRAGAQLDLRLKGDDWFSEADDQRREDMVATLRSVAAIEIDTVIVYDSSGNLRAAAVWFGNPPSVQVRLKD